MVNLRNRKVLSDSNTVARNPDKSQLPTRKRKVPDILPPQNKKSKVQDSASVEEEKENLGSPTTPQAPQLPVESKAETKEYEKTPGRDGPIKHHGDFTLRPDIKPFKGPPGKKVRNTAREKDREYTKFVLEHEDHPFYELHICFDKGPRPKSPTYDKSGFELDYRKVAEWMEPTPYNKNAMVKGMNRAVDKEIQEEAKMAEIFFEKGEAPAEQAYYDQAMHWKDRVSKDLHVPWHKIGVEHFVQWEKKGFKKARKGEYETFTDAENKRVSRLLDGASLRK